MKKTKPIGIFLFAAIAGLLIACGPNRDPGEQRPPNGPRPFPETVFVWQAAGGRDHILFVQAIQGIVARDAPQVYVMWNRPGNPFQRWLGLMEEKHGFTRVPVTDVWQLADIFRHKFTGFVLYPEHNTETMNYAATLAGLLNALPVSERMRSTAVARGWTQVANAADYTSVQQIINRYGSELNRTMFVNQRPQDEALRDFGIKHRAIIASPANAEGLVPIFNFLNPNAQMFGWFSEGQGGEILGLTQISAFNMGVFPADHAFNMSFLTDTTVRQHEQPRPIDWDLQAQPGKHYVAFVYADGDNIQWMYTDFPTSTNGFAHANPNNIPMGWSIPPALTKFGPVILDYIYGNARPRDNFVAGPSGYSYIFPSLFTNRQHLIEFGNLTAEFMRRSDLFYMEILDEHALRYDRIRDEDLEVFLRHDQIRGILYKTGSRYIGGRGFIRWVNNKPVVAFREALWNNRAGDLGVASESSRKRDAFEMAYRLSRYPKDHTSIDGYTLVTVHPWSHRFESVERIANWLSENDPNVIIVTPATLMRLIAENVPRVNAQPVWHSATGGMGGSNWTYPPEIEALWQP